MWFAALVSIVALPLAVAACAGRVKPCADCKDPFYDLTTVETPTPATIAPAPGTATAQAYTMEVRVRRASGDTITTEAPGRVVTTGLTAEVAESGTLRLSWATRPDARIHAATVRLSPGRRLVPLARLAGGGVAAVVVAVE